MSEATSEAAPFDQTWRLYHGAGWNTFPLPAEAKSPPPEGVTGRGGVRLQTATLASNEGHGLNIGIQVPKHIVGIDIDQYGAKRGWDNLEEWRVNAGLPPLPPTWRSSSRGVANPSGIRFYRVPAGFECAGVIVPDVEAIQWFHRYAVVAPSVHPDGRVYEWFDPEDVAGLVIPPFAALAELPREWVELLDEASDEEREERVRNPREAGPKAASGELGRVLGAWLNTLDADAMCWAVSQAVTDAVGDLETGAGGARHDRALRAVASLGHLAVEGHRGVKIGVGLVGNAFVKAVTADGTRTKGEAIAEWLRLWASDEYRPVLDGSVCDHVPFTQEPDGDPPGTPDAVLAKFPLLDLAEILNPNRPPRQWMWGDMVPEGDHVSIVAAGGTGKSLLVLALVVAMLRGEDEFIGKGLQAPPKVLYIDMENSPDDWAERLDDLGVTPEEAGSWAGRFLPMSFPRIAGLDTPEGAKQLVAILDAYGVGARDLVVLDSTQRVTDGDENSNDTIRRLYNLTSAELKRRGITVIRTDNTGHDGDRARGASAKRDDVAMSWTLALVTSTTDVFALTSKKKRSGGDADEVVFRRFTDDDGRLQFQTTDGVSFSQIAGHVRDVLDLAKVPHDMGVMAAWTLIKQLPEARRKGVTRALVRRIQGDRRQFATMQIVA